MFSSALISADVEIEDVIPEQFKNWFIVLSVYVTVLMPDINVPVVLKPTVESTVTIPVSYTHLTLPTKA